MKPRTKRKIKNAVLKITFSFILLLLLFSLSCLDSDGTTQYIMGGISVACMILLYPFAYVNFFNK